MVCLFDALQFAAATIEDGDDDDDNDYDDDGDDARKRTRINCTGVCWLMICCNNDCFLFCFVLFILLLSSLVNFFSSLSFFSRYFDDLHNVSQLLESTIMTTL